MEGGRSIGLAKRGQARSERRALLNSRQACPASAVTGMWCSALRNNGSFPFQKGKQQFNLRITAEQRAQQNRLTSHYSLLQHTWIWDGNGLFSSVLSCGDLTFPLICGLQLEYTQGSQQPMEAPLRYCCTNALTAKPAPKGLKSSFLFLYAKWKRQWVEFINSQLIGSSQAGTYKINCSKASMTNLSEICEELLRIFFEEQLCNFWVLQAARSAG